MERLFDFAAVCTEKRKQARKGSRLNAVNDEDEAILDHLGHLFNWPDISCFGWKSALDCFQTANNRLQANIIPFANTASQVCMVLPDRVF